MINNSPLQVRFSDGTDSLCAEVIEGAGAFTK